VNPRDGIDRGIVVMGVAGSGKTTIASALARQLGHEFRDGDSFHSAANVAKMAGDQPLTAQDRIPWLDSITAWLAATPRGIVACSALAHSHRDRLRRVGPLLILHLVITAPSARLRVSGRTGHFMPAGLVDDQFSTLETPAPDEPDVVPLDGELPVPVLTAYALSVVAGVMGDRAKP
jgi:gluconokinase